MAKCLKWSYFWILLEIEQSVFYNTKQLYKVSKSVGPFLSYHFKVVGDRQTEGHGFSVGFTFKMPHYLVWWGIKNQTKQIPFQNLLVHKAINELLNDVVGLTKGGIHDMVGRTEGSIQ